MASILVSLFGCTGLTEPEEDQSKRQTFRTGSQGLVLNFVRGSPPSDIYEGDRMDVAIEYTNKGAYDIEGGYIHLSGFDRNYLRFDRTMLTGIRAQGKDEFNPQGNMINTHTFTVSSANMPNEQDLFRQTIKATACYKYRTYATGSVCIDPDPFGVSHEEKVCVAGAPQVGGTQGAPVAVTNVEQQSSRRRVQFKVNIANVGGGTVIRPTAPISECHSQLERTDVDMVGVRAEFSDKQLRCEPDIVRISNGGGFAICYWEGDLGDEAYKTSLSIVLDYGYRNSIAKDVTIHRQPGRHTY
ncbi:MAG: hypothetical protein R6U32_05935 [Candidatus Woesearchaeota archaeon]